MLRTSVIHGLLLIVLATELSGETSKAPSDLPTKQQVLALLTETIDWYRHRTIERQLAVEPSDALFVEENRRIAPQIVQLAFDFAKADASLSSTTHQSAFRRFFLIFW